MIMTMLRVLNMDNLPKGSNQHEEHKAWLEHVTNQILRSCT